MPVAVPVITSAPNGASPIIVSGTGIAGALIEIRLDGTVISPATATADPAGNWTVAVPMTAGSHAVQARQTVGSAPAPATTRYQAEACTLGAGAAIASAHSGAEGSSYVNLATSGDYISKTGIDGGTGGAAKVKMRLRYNSGTTGRTAKLSVDSTVDYDVFMATTDPLAWVERVMYVQLDAGAGNSITIRVDDGDDISVDWFEVTPNMAAADEPARAIAGGDIRMLFDPTLTLGGQSYPIRYDACGAVANAPAMTPSNSDIESAANYVRRASDDAIRWQSQVTDPLNGARKLLRGLRADSDPASAYNPVEINWNPVIAAGTALPTDSTYWIAFDFRAVSTSWTTDATDLIIAHLLTAGVGSNVESWLDLVINAGQIGMTVRSSVALPAVSGDTTVSFAEVALGAVTVDTRNVFAIKVRPGQASDGGVELYRNGVLLKSFVGNVGYAGGATYARTGLYAPATATDHEWLTAGPVFVLDPTNVYTAGDITNHIDTAVGF